MVQESTFRLRLAEVNSIKSHEVTAVHICSDTGVRVLSGMPWAWKSFDIASINGVTQTLYQIRHLKLPALAAAPLSDRHGSRWDAVDDEAYYRYSCGCKGTMRFSPNVVTRRREVSGVHVSLHFSTNNPMLSPATPELIRSTHFCVSHFLQRFLIGDHGSSRSSSSPAPLVDRILSSLGSIV